MPAPIIVIFFFGNGLKKLRNGALNQVVSRQFSGIGTSRPLLITQCDTFAPGVRATLKIFFARNNEMQAAGHR